MAYQTGDIKKGLLHRQRKRKEKIGPKHGKEGDLNTELANGTGQSGREGGRHIKVKRKTLR